MPRKTMISLLLLLIVSAVSIRIVLAQTDEPPAEPGNGNIVIDPDEAAQDAIDIAETTAEGLSGLVTDFVERLNTPPDSTIIQILMIIGGVVLLVAGWRIYDWIIILAGALIGGASAVAAISSTNTVLMMAAFLIGAVIGAGLAIFLYYVAIFLVGAYAGIVFLSVLAGAIDWSPLPTWVLFVALVIGGIIMLGISFEFLVVLASVVGAQLLVTALGLSPQATWIIILTLLGIVIQIAMSRRFGYRIRRRPARRLLRR